MTGIALFHLSAGVSRCCFVLFGGGFIYRCGLFGILSNLNRHVRAHLTAQGAAGAVGGVNYLGVMEAGVVKQLAHPDIGPWTLGHAKAAPFTPLFVYLDISHKMPKTVLTHI